MQIWWRVEFPNKSIFQRREIELQKQVMPLRHVVAVPAKPSVTSELTEDKLVSDKSIKEEEEIERQKMQ